MTTTRIAIVGLVLAAVSSTRAIGATLFETDFESPDYTCAVASSSPSSCTLIGQDEWFAALGGNAATVSTELPKSPTQSVRIDGSLLEPFFGFHFGSYARPLSFDPVGSGLPIVTLSGFVNLIGDVAPTCGTGLGLTGLGDELPNVLIGIMADDTGQLKPYLSNADTSIVFGPTYTPGVWVELKAVFNYQSQTVEGFVDGVLMGEVPFTAGASSQIAFLNMSLGSSVPVPGVIAYNDDYRVTASGIHEIPTVSEWGLIIMALLLLTGSAVVIRRRNVAANNSWKCPE